MTDELTQLDMGQLPSTENALDDPLVAKVAMLVGMLEAKLEKAAEAREIPPDVPQFVSR